MGTLLPKNCTYTPLRITIFGVTRGGRPYSEGASVMFGKTAHSLIVSELAGVKHKSDGAA